MGWLTHALTGSTGGGGGLGIDFGSAYTPFKPNATGGGGGYQQRSLVEKIDLNAASKSAVGLFGDLGRAPARIYESPISLVDTAIQRATGVSPLQAFGNTAPGAVLGAAGGFLGEALNRSGNFIPSIINSGDMKVWSAVADLPDDTPITDELVKRQLGIDGPLSWVQDFGESTGGLPILGLLGIGSRPKTVGEFRQELAERGMFSNPDTGEALDPTQVGLDIRNDAKSTFDYGFAGINDNALVDLGGRLALDPSNALLFVPGANIAKAGSLGARIFGLSKLAKVGIATSEIAPMAIKSAEAISRGSRAGATLRGLSTFLKGYQKVSLATAAGEFGVNRLSGFAANNNLPVPFAREINDFTNAVEKNQPLSGNSAFMLLSAATFPYNATVIRPIRTAGGKLRAVTVGADDLAPFSRAFGGRAKFSEAVGGEQGMQDLHGFLLVQEARARHMLTPAEQVKASSLPSLALRRKFEQQAFERRGAQAWANGEITAHDLFDRFKVWAEEQGGVVSHDAAGNRIDQGVRLPFDSERAASTWRTFNEEVKPRFKQVLDQTGELIWGERDDVIFREQLDLGLQTFRSVAKNGRVPKSAILDYLEDNPNVNSLDKHGFWQRIIAEDGDPLLKNVENKLKGQKRTAVKTDDYFADVAQWENTAPPDPDITNGPVAESRGDRIARLRDELNTSIETEGVTDKARNIQRELEDEIAAAKDVRWARDTSVEPELARAVEDELPKVDPNLVPEFVFPGLRGDAEMVGRVVGLEKELRDAGLHTKYRVKAIGTDQALATIPDRPIIANIRKHTAVGDWLFERSPFSPFGKFMHAITRPIGHGELSRGQHQALMNEMIPRGFSAKEVNVLTAALEQRVKESVFIDKGSFQARLYRDPGSLLPGQVREIARRVLVDEAANPQSAQKAAKALSALEKDGGVYRLLSRAGSRYWRSLHDKAMKGDRGAKALENIYRTWNDAPVLHNLATSQRVLAKFIYPVSRFLLDPRWLMLNTIEGETLAFSKSGIVQAYKQMLDASPAARRMLGGEKLEEALASFSPEVGVTLTNKNLQLLLLKDFDVRSGKSIVKVLNELGDTDPATVALRRRMAREADDLDVQAKSLDDADDAAKLRQRAKNLREASTQEMARSLNDTLYRFEKDGVAKATRSEFEKFLDDDELHAMRPLIDRVVEINQQTWHDVQSLYHGNPSRSTLERIGNSYWLYWPLSYQIKATKWLADIMLNGSFGHENGALLAGKYALWKQQHEDRMAKNPAYRAMYQANPELWFAVQQLLPMSPESIGVSLGKATDIAGDRGQDFINHWLNTDIGLFTRSVSNEKVVPFLTEMGPMYTGELISRIYQEAEDQGFFRPAPDIARPAPSAP